METLRTVIFTGLSGGGKTTALRAVEDVGFHCVDNLPLPLINDFIETMKAEPVVGKAALVVDARLRHYIEGYALAYATLCAAGNDLEVVYLDARDDVLVRRFSQTRRRHPLGGSDLLAGLREERELLAPLQAQARTSIDTSDLTVHELKAMIQDRYRAVGERAGMSASLLSFGFRHGLPSHADLVFDVRFLPNPYFNDALRHRTGLDRPVAEFVLNAAEADEFVVRITGLLEYLLPHYEREGKNYVTIAIGCTGGHHRSVAVAEELGRRLGPERSISVHHRDINR
jgi:RNase adapter protein RapZ